MPIKLLSEDVASRIAAGEVVERPASVVKELVENSLDAGATRVEIETRDGGRALIRVRDNGCGIHSTEVGLAFRRHATSKLESADDLERIATLGFRGEALSSVAAVSRLTCVTCHQSEAVGTRLRLEGGEVVTQGAVGRPAGTEIVVEDLFYNVPARRKFLRTDRTERRHIDGFATRYAIAYPDTAFTVVHDGREALSTPGKGDPREVLLSVYGVDLGSELLDIPRSLTATDAIHVRGFVGPTSVHRANRGYITLFINGRWIEDLRLSYAIIQAYHTLLPVQRYPVAFVIIDMPPQDVDVNVHPTKAEVRFRDGDAVFRAVQRAVRATVVNQAPTTATWSPPEHGTEEDREIQRRRLAGLQPAQQQAIRFTWDDVPADRGDSGSGSVGFGESDKHASTTQAFDANATRTESALSPRPGTTDQQHRQHLPMLRVVGQLATMFIIAEGPDGLYLVDQHAAHERVLYEHMVANAVQGEVPRQPLLEPAAVTLPPDEASEVEALMPTLAAVGIEIEPFGPATFLVRTVPVPLQSIAPGDLLADVAASAHPDGPGATKSSVQSQMEEVIIRHICKRAAVKAGQVLSREEMERLIRDLEHTENPRTCPHGRPTIIKISTEELARQFGRGGL